MEFVAGMCSAASCMRNFLHAPYSLMCELRCIQCTRKCRSARTHALECLCISIYFELCVRASGGMGARASISDVVGVICMHVHTHGWLHVDASCSSIVVVAKRVHVRECSTRDAN
eukprot:6202497-Pleurochrysis_carterae.AAC.1